MDLILFLLRMSYRHAPDRGISYHLETVRIGLRILGEGIYE